MRCADPGQKVTGRDKRVAFCTVAFLFIYIFICPYTAIAHRTHCWSESVNITLSAAVLCLDRHISYRQRWFRLISMILIVFTCQ